MTVLLCLLSFASPVFFLAAVAMRLRRGNLGDPNFHDHTIRQAHLTHQHNANQRAGGFGGGGRL